MSDSLWMLDYYDTGRGRQGYTEDRGISERPMASELASPAAARQISGSRGQTIQKSGRYFLEYRSTLVRWCPIE